VVPKEFQSPHPPLWTSTAVPRMAAGVAARHHLPPREKRTVGNPGDPLPTETSFAEPGQAR
jgi:hypothetical protein